VLLQRIFSIFLILSTFSYLSFYICGTVLCNKANSLSVYLFIVPWVAFWACILHVCQTAFWIDRFHWFLSFTVLCYCMHFISRAYSFLVVLSSGSETREAQKLYEFDIFVKYKNGSCCNKMKWWCSLYLCVCSLYISSQDTVKHVYFTSMKFSRFE